MIDSLTIGMSATKLLTLAAAVAVFVYFAALGKAVCRNGAADAQWAAGWGVVALVLTTLGVVGVPLWAGALALVPVAVLGLRHLPEDRETWRGYARIAVLGLPFLWIVALVNVSAVDTFTHWLPNAVHLYDTHAFPSRSALGVAEAYPAFPYNLQFVFYLAGLVLPYQPDTAMIAFNGILVLALATTLAHLIARDGVVSWSVAAVALLLATLLNPTFVPPLVLVPYGDFATSLLVMVFGLLAWRILEAAPQGGAPPMQAGLVLAALINLKQANPALAGVLVVAFVIVALLRPETRGRWLLRTLAQIAAPGLAVFLLWRLYVAVHLPGGENQLLPWAAWQWDHLWQILRSMFIVAINKGGHFGLMTIIVGAAVWALARRRQGPLPHLALYVALVFLGYTLFLLLIYIGHFTGTASIRAQSYWRFNTHLGPLALMAAVVAVRAWLDRRPRPLVSKRVRRTAGGAVVVLTLTGSALGSPLLRVDLKNDQQIVWNIGEDVARVAPPDATLGVVVPGDVGNLTWLMKGVLTQSAARRHDLTVTIRNSLPARIPEAWDTLWLACVPPELDARLGLSLPAEGAVLLLRRNDAWMVIRRWPVQVGFCAER